LALGLGHAARAEDGAKSAEAPTLLALLPADSVTGHSATLGGVKLDYTATAGTLTLRDGKGERTGAMFYVAYTQKGAPAASRPVTFCFNGGPGAGSAFLHLGAAGPVALETPAIVTDGAGARLKDNPDSWLAFTDLVFIDAMGTGWSRPAKPDDAARLFWGVRQDASTFARAVALWLAHNARTASPKFLAGESYGGFRAVRLAAALQAEEGTLVDGLIMVSPLIDWSFNDTGHNPLADAVHLPSLVASELERRHAFALPPVEESWHWALGEYLTALAGTPPTGEAATKLYDRLGTLTGIPTPVIARSGGWIDPSSHDARIHDGLYVSVYEGSLGIPDPFPNGDDGGDDPLLDGYVRAYGNAFVGYAGEALGYRTDLPYELLSGEVGDKWDWRDRGDIVRGVTDDLRRLLALDPALRVLIAHGYFDLITPFGASRWTIEHLPLGRDRVRLAVYPGGHMLYTRPASRAALAKDVRALEAGH
jgi:carboxypeptidase C (cathepsin A)